MTYHNFLIVRETAASDSDVGLRTDTERRAALTSYTNIYRALCVAPLAKSKNRATQLHVRCCFTFWP